MTLLLSLLVFLPANATPSNSSPILYQCEAQNTMRQTFTARDEDLSQATSKALEACQKSVAPEGCKVANCHPVQ